MNSDPYNNLKVIKKFSGGIHAGSVVLMEKDVVKKMYNQDNKIFFRREIDALKKLHKCDFIPNILWINYEKLYRNHKNLFTNFFNWFLIILW